MNRVETIKSIKESLKSLFVKHSFAEYTLKDGSKIVCDDDKVGVGSAVYSLAEDGTREAINDGVYELESGAKLEVVGGLVKNIMETETEEEVENMGEMKPEATTDESPRNEEMKLRLETLEAQVGELISLVEKMAKSQNGIIEKMSAPAESSVKTEAKGFNGFSNDLNFNKVTRRNEIEDIRKLLTEKRKSDNNYNLSI